MRAATVMVTTAVALLVPPAAQAQQWQPEARFDVLGPAPASYQAGIGVVGFFGYYARVSVDVARDVRPNPDVQFAPWRADLIARVTLDPFREQRVGFSFGGGLSVRKQVLICAVAELEGPETYGVMPSLHLGVGGGVRVGVVLRRPIQGRR